MGYAILNRLLGLVNKTLKMSFFQDNFHFHNLSRVLDQWRLKKRTSLKEDSNWIEILKPRYKTKYNTLGVVIGNIVQWGAPHYSKVQFTRRQNISV